MTVTELLTFGFYIKFKIHFLKFIGICFVNVALATQHLDLFCYVLGYCLQ